MGSRVKVYGLLGVAALAAASFSVWKTKPKWFPGMTAAAATSDNTKAPQTEAIAVQLAAAEVGKISSFLTATANLRATREVPVATQAEGIVQKVLAEEGDAVKEGQLLCQLDDTELRIRLDLAQERLAQAQLQMEKARIREERTDGQLSAQKVELARQESAFKEGLVSEKEVAALRYRLDELGHDQRLSLSDSKELQHRVSELEAEIVQSKLSISRTQILAPFDGQITQRNVNFGQRVRALESLFTLGASSPLQADVYLSERDTRLVRPGQSAEIFLGADEASKVQGRVERISPIVDQASGTVKVTVALEPAPGFRPGSFVRVAIRADTKMNALLIPKQAILEEDGQSYVYIMATSDTAKRMKVELGYSSEGMVEVRNGLTAGQKVIVAGQGAIKENSKIKVVQG